HTKSNWSKRRKEPRTARQFLRQLARAIGIQWTKPATPSFASPRESSRVRTPRNSCRKITRFTAVFIQRFAVSTPAIPCSHPPDFLRILRFELQAIDYSDHGQQSASPD